MSRRQQPVKVFASARPKIPFNPEWYKEKDGSFKIFKWKITNHWSNFCRECGGVTMRYDAICKWCVICPNTKLKYKDCVCQDCLL
jgi:hypothetical protein